MSILLIFLLVVGWFVISAIQASSHTKPSVIPEELNLNSVRNALMEKQGWSRERAEAARREYVRFLTLLQMKPGFMLVPWPTAEGKDDLDQFWHQHILDTAKYEIDCKRLFGRMIHHNPHVVRGSEHESDAVAKTQRLYARTFGTGTNGLEFDAVLWGSCSSCGTVDSSGGDKGCGHGDHGSHGDSGGHGSHSCGGHSCGGHGCGHGCGGH